MPKKTKHPTTQYALDIVSGKILANKWTRLACQRHLGDLKEGGKRGLYFDEAAANHIIMFFEEFLVFYEGEFDGKPFILTPWQKFLLGSIFGWKKKPEGYRRFKTIFCLTGKGNGKSPIAAGIGLYGLCFDDEPGAEVYCVDPSTLILYNDLIWRKIENAKIGDKLVAFDEAANKSQPGNRSQYRKLRMAYITAINHTFKLAYKIKLSDGSELIAGENHPWLCRTFRDYGWKYTKNIKPGWKIRKIVDVWQEDHSKEAGYLAGFLDGEGCYHSITTKRAAHRIGFSQKAGLVLSRVLDLFAKRNYIISKPRKQAHNNVYYHTITGLNQCLRLLGTIRPIRLMDGWENKIVGKSLNRSVDMIKVLSIESIGHKELIDITTTTKTFIANGFASHNSAAVTRDQAGILFRDARTYAQKSDSLREILKIDQHNISFIAENSYFRPVSSEHRGLDGKRPHIALIDEIHEHPTDLVVRKMSAGTKTRRQPLIFEITNAGVNRNSICYQHFEYTIKILEASTRGEIFNDEWFGLISGLDVCPKCEKEGKTIPQDGCPDCDNWQDEKCWPKSNPNIEYLGKSFHEYLHRQHKEAKGMPSQENIVKRLNDCIWTESITKWVSADAWDACADKTLRLEDFAGEPCYLAFDLANKIDISALIIVFNRDDELYTFGRYYLPEETIIRSKIIHYRQWVKEGYIIKTPGAMTDYRYIEDDIVKINEINPIIELAFDPHEATYLVNNLMEWLGQDKCIQIKQGPALISEPMKQLEGIIYDRKIHHNDDPVLAWMISNVVKKEGRNSGPVKFYYPTKTSEDNKIDGAVALIMGVGRATLNKGPEKSIYDSLSYEEIKQRIAL